MSEELPLESVPSWTVEPVFGRETAKMRKAKIKPELKHYELRYGHAVQAKAIGHADVERLRETAKFCNARKLTPRDRIECAADAPNPANYLRDQVAPPPQKVTC